MNPNPQQIKQAREKAGLTQQQCADLLYVTVNTWKKWEYGDNKMSRGYWELFQIKKSHNLAIWLYLLEALV